MNLYVGNLAYSMDEHELEELFTKYGQVTSVKIIRDRETNRSKGFGFVEMADRGQAQEAINQLNNQVIKQRKIVVNEARPRKQPGDRGGNRKPYSS
jgi:RNA recognition motif-containing protein